MNFLLYMLGGAGRNGGGLRPTLRQQVLAAAAGHVTNGHFQEALQGYRRLGDSPAVTDGLVRGHLHLMCDELPAAARCFAQGIERLLETRDANPGETSVEQLTNEATSLLKAGRYVRATELLVRARALLDTLMAAEAGLLLAQGAGLEPLAGLVRLRDLTLRLLAKIQVGRHLATSLEERHLRADLAPWATSAESVQTLLESETQRLAVLAKGMPGHAEMQYRLGLVARAAGGHANLERAAAAFRGVLAVHPHHVASAVCLAVTLEQVGRGGGRAVLQQAFRVPAETLRTFAAFAWAAGEAAAFDRMAEKTCADGSAARGNLAFALSELGLLDAARETWREAAPVA